MKNILLTATVLLGFGIAHSQNINDNKIAFNYIQLPSTKIDDSFSTYEVNVEHDYNLANQDSLALFEARKELAMNSFLQQVARYQSKRDSLDKIYINKLSAWQKNTNAGLKNADGTPLAKPAPPTFPAPPVYPNIVSPQLHSPYTNENVNQRISLSGFEKGSGGVQITVRILPIQSIHITSKINGTAASTKYTYTAHYVLPISLTVASPSQGILTETILFTNSKSYHIGDYKSQYDYDLYMMDNKAQFFSNLESHARSQALVETNSTLNDQFGYVNQTRNVEIYSVKSFKNYEYSDVTQSYTLTVQALQAVGADRNHSGAMDELENAINSIKLILEESSLSDEKTRINPKVTAMLQCNLAELLMWQGEFAKSEATVNLALNSGEGKAKRHCQNQQQFYADQHKRWGVHY